MRPRPYYRKSNAGSARVSQPSKALVPLYLCFIYLQKAYDSVDRSVLWQILARYGVTLRFIAVIRQFHEGMRACVRNDNGDCSEELT